MRRGKLADGDHDKKSLKCRKNVNSKPGGDGS